MKALPQAVSQGKQLLLKFKSSAAIETSNGSKESSVSGEAIVVVRGDHPTNRGLSLERFALAGTSVDAQRGPTGVISVIGKTAGGIIEARGDEVLLRVEMTCEINYESMDRSLVPDMEKGDYYLPAMEPAAGYISGRLAEERDSLTLADCTIKVVCAAGRFNEIQLISLELGSVPLLPLFPTRERIRDVNENGHTVSADSNADSNICIQVNRRQIIIQPVGFRDSAGDPNPSGSTATAQLNTAAAVWGKSCIDFQINPIQLITDATLKTSSSLTNIRNSYTDGNPNVIEVFFVANPLTAQGGGSAGGIGVASCKPVIAEPNSGNPVLVAHELGHVLGLLHPGSGSNSDAGTVMAPTGSPMNPGTNTVTHYMCMNISTPVLQTLTTLCCLSHDIGNHYIRDFPVDTGAEPSDPLPAGMTRYSMSNVWNRRSNTPGSFSSATGPEHEQPLRFVSSTDFTPYTNYLFAKVEQLVNLLVRNAVVKFYIKTPGSGGGSANLQFIGQVSVPNALAVGVPQTISMPWTIPTGTPQHSCIFAVVRSDAEQEGDQSGLDWWQFENLSRTDNDWAQRNLEIEDYGSGNIGDDNTVESAPFIIRIPPDQGYDQQQLSLTVDASGAKGLSGLSLEVPGKERFELRPGEPNKITPQTPIYPGQDFIVVLQGIIPGGMRPGSTFTINVDPQAGQRQMVGFACTFRIGRPRAVISQFLDVTASAYVDLAELTELPFAHRMVEECRALLKEPPRSYADLAKALLPFESILQEAEAELVEVRAAEEFGVAEAISEWRKMVGRYKKGSVSALELSNGFRKVSQRLTVTAAILAEGARSPSRHDVQVILDRVEIDYDQDLLSPGEFYFLSEVETKDGLVMKRRLPAHGFYSVNAGCKAATLQLDALLYEGQPGGELKIRLEGWEADIFGFDDRLCRYERHLKGEPDSIRGSYVPGDESLDLEQLEDWRVYYRVV